MAAPRLHIDGPQGAPTLVLAHGAVAGMHTPFMDFFAEGLAERGLRVARFEFPYMARARASGKREPPDSEAVLRETWMSAIQSLGPDGLFIGGKSMGGRIASLLADQAGVRGLVCLGYPFHPMGKPAQLRTAHLETLTCPALIVQGTRDIMGARDEVAGYRLSRTIEILWLEDGDHDLKPRKAVSGFTAAQHLKTMATRAAAWAKEL